LPKNAVVKVKRLRASAALPDRASPGASGFDLYACLEGSPALEVGPDPVIVPTGIAIELPRGIDAQVRPRSGLSSQGVEVSMGTIDSDYRGEIFITMHVFGSRRSHIVHHGDRIAQLVLSALTDVSIQEAETLTETKRGAGRHGSTGA